MFNKPSDQMYQKFLDMFGVSLSIYYHPIFGFDVIEFDEKFLKTPDGISTKDYLTEKYNQDAADLILSLINFERFND